MPNTSIRDAWRNAVAIAIIVLFASVAAPASSLAVGIGAGASDQDGDGLSDLQELEWYATDPQRADTDGDGLRDGFEVRWGATDPNQRDSDGDGIHDSAEDEDGDRLSNLGEQRFKTDPSDTDSDDDGTKDGGEDANGNDIRDALEQDFRKVPAQLRPALEDASRDRPVSYADGCHSGLYPAVILPCTYGDADGHLSIALFGDSHALQWLPALDRAGKTQGWRITTLTKSICPSVAVRFAEPVWRPASASCLRWRDKALRWLRKNPPDIVLLTNSGRYRVIGGNGRKLRYKARQQRWRVGLARVIKSMPSRTRVIVLADTPHLDKSAPECLQGNGRRISHCQTRRARSLIDRRDRVERDAVESLGGVFVDLNHAVCSYDPCPLIVDDIMIWRDKGHLTATYSRELAPAMRRTIESVLSTASAS